MFETSLKKFKYQSMSCKINLNANKIRDPFNLSIEKKITVEQ